MHSVNSIPSTPSFSLKSEHLRSNSVSSTDSSFSLRPEHLTTTGHHDSGHSQDGRGEAASVHPQDHGKASGPAKSGLLRSFSARVAGKFGSSGSNSAHQQTPGHQGPAAKPNRNSMLSKLGRSVSARISRKPPPRSNSVDSASQWSASSASLNHENHKLFGPGTTPHPDKYFGHAENHQGHATASHDNSHHDHQQSPAAKSGGSRLSGVFSKKVGQPMSNLVRKLSSRVSGKK